MSKKLKIKAFDKATCRLIGEAFHKMAEEFASQYGLTIKPSGGRFDTNSFTPKVTFMIPTVDAESGETVNKKDLETFKRMAPLFDIDPEAFGKVIKLSDGHSYRIVGWNPRAPKSPINIIQIGTNKPYKVKREIVQRFFPAPSEKTKKVKR